MDYELNIKHRNLLNLSYFDENDNINFKNNITYSSNMVSNELHCLENISCNNMLFTDYFQSNDLTCTSILSNCELSTYNITANNIITNDITIMNKLDIQDGLHRNVVINGDVITSNIISDTLETTLITSNSLTFVSDRIIFGNKDSAINMYGTKTNIILDDYKIVDKSFDINKNKNTLLAFDIGNNSGIEIKNINSNDGYIKTTEDATNFLFKLPNGIDTFALTVNKTNDLISNVTILNHGNSMLYGNCVINNNAYINNVTVNSIICNNDMYTKDMTCNNIDVKDNITYSDITCNDINIVHDCIVDTNGIIHNILHNISDNTMIENMHVHNNINSNINVCTNITTRNIINNNAYVNKNFTVSNMLNVQNMIILQNITTNNNINTDNIINKNFDINKNIDVVDEFANSSNITVNSNVVFNGKLLIKDVVEYINDGLAGDNNIPNGQIYRTGGILKIKLHPLVKLIQYTSDNISSTFYWGHRNDVNRGHPTFELHNERMLQNDKSAIALSTQWLDTYFNYDSSWSFVWLSKDARTTVDYELIIDPSQTHWNSTTSTNASGQHLPGEIYITPHGNDTNMNGFNVITKDVNVFGNTGSNHWGSNPVSLYNMLFYDNRGYINYELFLLDGTRVFYAKTTDPITFENRKSPFSHYISGNGDSADYEFSRNMVYHPHAVTYNVFTEYFPA